MSDVKLPVRKGEHVRDATDDPGYGEVCLDEFWRILDADGAEVCRANTEPIADSFIRAVNSHEALVEACRYTHTCILDQEIPIGNRRLLYRMTGDALALAEPEHPTNTE